MVSKKKETAKKPKAKAKAKPKTKTSPGDILKRVGTAGTIPAKKTHVWPMNADGSYCYKDGTETASQGPKIIPPLPRGTDGAYLPLPPEQKRDTLPYRVHPTEADCAHLSMLQGIIGRMGFCSFAVKLFSIMVFCTMLLAVPLYLNQIAAGAFGITKMLLIMTWPFVGLAFFDAFYLRLERAYRLLFDEYRKYHVLPNDPEPEYLQVIQNFKCVPIHLKSVTYRSVMISTTQIWFYLGQWAVLMGMVWFLVY